jgi:hypothetical protein
MRTFCPDLPLCREASNYSSLHLYGRFSNTFERHSVFDQLQDFFPKHRYRKFVVTPVRTRSSIRQVSHSKSRRPDASLHGLDARASNMEIACIRSTVRTTIPLVRMREALIWKFLAADDIATSSRRSSNQERISAKFWKVDRTVVRPDGA